MSRSNSRPKACAMNMARLIRQTRPRGNRSTLVHQDKREKLRLNALRRDLQREA